MSDEKKQFTNDEKVKVRYLDENLKPCTFLMSPEAHYIGCMLIHIGADISDLRDSINDQTSVLKEFFDRS